MNTDHIDALQRDWANERPDLNSEPMGVVLRIQVLAKLLSEQASQCLREYGLEWWQYDVLAALRRRSDPLLAMTRLAEEVMLTSGAMTNRIDRLEELGWVRRQADRKDRRKVLVRLTSAGQDVVDRATEARFRAAERAIEGLTAAERSHLSGLLRDVVLSQH